MKFFKIIIGIMLAANTVMSNNITISTKFPTMYKVIDGLNIERTNFIFPGGNENVNAGWAGINSIQWLENGKLYQVTINWKTGTNDGRDVVIQEGGLIYIGATRSLTASTEGELGVLKATIIR